MTVSLKWVSELINHFPSVKLQVWLRFVIQPHPTELQSSFESVRQLKHNLKFLPCDLLHLSSQALQSITKFRITGLQWSGCGWTAQSTWVSSLLSTILTQPGTTGSEAVYDVTRVHFLQRESEVVRVEQQSDWRSINSAERKHCFIHTFTDNAANVHPLIQLWSFLLHVYVSKHINI